MNARRPWWRDCRREHLASDVLAGLLVTVLVLPQSLAYAMLAGLPPQAGLYVSILPVVAYALVGSSMTQAVGPVAITAIMTSAVLNPLATPGSPAYLAMAATVALLSGLLILAFGALRLGFLSRLLSRPVISGFISGSALMILASQVRPLLGLPGHGALSLSQLLTTLTQPSPTNRLSLLIGGSGLVLLYLSRRFLAKALVQVGVARERAEFCVRLAPLLAVAVATIAVTVLDLDVNGGVAVVGPVAKGLPAFGFAMADPAAMAALIVPALILAFIGSVQNLTMAQSLAIQRRERVDANRELIGLGLSNVVAAFFGGMPVGGGLSRSAVNVASGARTPLASLVSAAFMLLIVWTGAGAFARVPLAILAASIAVAAMGMVDWPLLRRAWAYDRADALAFLGTSLGVLLLGLQLGIALGIGLSLGVFLYRSSTPHIAVVGRIAGSEHFRNVDRHSVETIPGVVFLRIDESLFFGNLGAVETRILDTLSGAADLRALVLVMSAVNRVDHTAMEALTEIDADLRSRGMVLHLAEVKGPVQDRMQGTPLWTVLEGRIHLSANDAFELLGPGRASQAVGGGA